jgi:hypothetical protein
LGQPLKSFRDRKVKFDIYSTDQSTEFLETLGPLAKPKRNRGNTPAIAKSDPPSDHHGVSLET